MKPTKITVMLAVKKTMPIVSEITFPKYEFPKIFTKKLETFTPKTDKNAVTKSQKMIFKKNIIFFSHKQEHIKKKWSFK